MKRYAPIALTLALIMSLMAGCRSPMADSTATTGAGTPTTPTTLPAGTLMTDPSTHPTSPTDPTPGQSMPSESISGSTATGTARGRR